MNATWLSPPSVLAFVTTMHLALVVLRSHRSYGAGVFNFVTMISLCFTASPWMMPSLWGLVVGLLVHGSWFAACEWLLPAPASTAAAPARRTAQTTVRPATGIAQMARKPPQFVAAPVMAVFEETPDIRTFRLARPERFDFKAGQFLTVRVRAEGREHVRCYSISSPPAARGHLEITVKRVGLVSGALHATVRPGAILSVRAPAGAFVYPAGEDRPIVLIAGGVGITPLMSMLRHAIDAEPARPVTLLYSVRTLADVAFRDELMLLDRRHEQVRVVITVTEGPADNDTLAGRINEALLGAVAPDIAHSVCLLCGPQSMLDAMTTLLTSMGVPRTQIGFEVFQAAIAATGTAGSPASETAPAAIGSHHVRFDRSGLTANVGAGQTMLEAAEDCGADIPSLCRAGVCGTCRTRVLNGDVSCASKILDEQDRDDGFVLACVTHVASDCTVDA